MKRASWRPGGTVGLKARSAPLCPLLLPPSSCEQDEWLFPEDFGSTEPATGNRGGEAVRLFLPGCIALMAAGLLSAVLLTMPVNSGAPWTGQRPPVPEAAP